MTAKTEQGLLRSSIAVTVVVSAIGIVLGILSGSFSVTFDGIYALADASMSGLALLVTRLISVSTTQPSHMSRFNMGFWHLEPMVLALNSALLMAVSGYALVNAITSLMNEGHPLAFGYAIVYAFVIAVICAAMGIYELKANRVLKSDFIGLDAKSWFMSGAISVALLVAFSIGYVIEGTEHDWMTPYIDPAVLALVCVIVIPMPLATLRHAISDILLIAPDDLVAEVEAVAGEIVRQEGFVTFHAYAARVGRARQVELHFVVPEDWPPAPMPVFDRIRRQVSDALGNEGPDRWLTVCFTANPEWAV